MLDCNLSPEERKQFGEMEREIVYRKLRLSCLMDYINAQKEGFITVMNIICDRLSNLIDKGEITGFIDLRTRIKSLESAINNSDNKKDKNLKYKKLDDIFGMEIMTATEREYHTIINKLHPLMHECKGKEYNKENGYKAIHKMWVIKEEILRQYSNLELDYQGNIPMIEFQFKTFAVSVECNENHIDYKGEKMQDVQDKFCRGEFNEYNTPTMWISKFDYTKNGSTVIKMELLNKNATLKQIYPKLVTDAYIKDIILE